MWIKDEQLKQGFTKKSYRILTGNLSAMFPKKINTNSRDINKKTIPLTYGWGEKEINRKPEKDKRTKHFIRKDYF